jgi:hypothetical protein
VKLEIQCPHHRGVETLELPENFLGKTLCNPGNGERPQPLHMKVVSGKIQKIYSLLPEPPVDFSLECQMEYWKSQAQVYSDLYLAVCAPDWNH